MTTQADSLYDRIPYQNLPVTDAHPDRLAALARLFGIEPTPLENCKVLELGCGDGSHLIPIALAWPGSRCVGIDLARVPITVGQQLLGELGLANIALHHLDLNDLNAGLGEFDYIIAHGLYSWVPPATRDRLLEVCKAHLAPNGVAFVSYNTYPGCHLRDMVREMLLYQTRGISDPELKIKHAYALVNMLASSATNIAVLAEELEALRSRSVGSVFHDDLAEINDPVYFHQFVEHARHHGLDYLTEAEFKAVGHGGLSEETTQTLRLVAGGDRIQEQQYLDFLRCRRFRQTLLCHQGMSLLETPDACRVPELLAASPLQPVSASAEAGSDAEEEFRSPAGYSLKTNLPLAKATLLHLSKRWPLAAPFADLAAAVQRDAAPEQDTSTPLAELLLRLCLSGVVELHTVPSRFTTVISEHPRAFRLALLQARNGPRVTTLRHTTVEFQDEPSRWLILLLDGTRDRAALLRGLQEQATQNGLPQTVQSADLERNLQNAARLALLEA